MKNIKQPKSPLPWIKGESWRYNCVAVKSKEIGVCILPEDEEYKGQSDKDAEYIVQACNNFPKAVELLKDVVHPESSYDDYNDEIKKFLKSLEE